MEDKKVNPDQAEGLRLFAESSHVIEVINAIMQNIKRLDRAHESKITSIEFKPVIVPPLGHRPSYIVGHITLGSDQTAEEFQKDPMAQKYHRRYVHVGEMREGGKFTVYFYSLETDDDSEKEYSYDMVDTFKAAGIDIVLHFFKD